MGVIETAKSYLGKVKYVFGADNIDGGTGDCSSFTQTVFKKNGFDIGRDTEAQWSTGNPVDKDSLQSGDLVFFANTYNNDHKDGVSHVGIYEGDGQFIHLSNKGVNEANLSSEYWASHYLGARRVDGASVSEGTNSSKGSEIGLTWWGDIVKVVLAGLLIVAGVAMLVLGVKSKL